MTDSLSTGNRPKVIVSCLVVQDDHVLMAHKIGGTQDGKIVTPGGHVEFGETMVQAAIRELREETTLMAGGGELLAVEEVISPDLHVVAGIVLMRDVSGSVVTGVELADPRYYLKAYYQTYPLDFSPVTRASLRCIGWSVSQSG